ncbi:RHS repeat-associated core domain-containing protein [Sorangium sp. So ce726]|uniref:RHS repeat-associated core domain-containing protein n=1 Tax=Sorangium sp. So ce726 TaxID=3133319 RepID=UPI003F5FDB33
MFTEKELDRATGLYYFGAAYYDSRISVWLSQDPILDEHMEGGGNTIRLRLVCAHDA